MRVNVQFKILAQFLHLLDKGNFVERCVRINLSQHQFWGGSIYKRLAKCFKAGASSKALPNLVTPRYNSVDSNSSPDYSWDQVKAKCINRFQDDNSKYNSSYIKNSDQNNQALGTSLQSNVLAKMPMVHQIAPTTSEFGQLNLRGPKSANAVSKM